MGISEAEAKRLAAAAAKGREQPAQAIAQVVRNQQLDEADSEYLRDAFRFYWRTFSTIFPYPFKPEEYVVAGRYFRFDDYYEYELESEYGTTRAIALEFDGKVHQHPDRWERDHEKMAIAASLGVLVVPLTYRQIMEEPERYVSLVESML